MLSYEVLKFNFANSNSLIAKFFAAPGIWTQFITTKKPSTDQIEVAILSMANCVENSENTKKDDKRKEENIPLSTEASSSRAINELRLLNEKLPAYQV